MKRWLCNAITPDRSKMYQQRNKERKSKTNTEEIYRTRKKLVV